MLLADACGHTQSHAVGIQQLKMVRVSITLSTVGSPYLVDAAVDTTVRLLFPAGAKAQHMCSA